MTKTKKQQRAEVVARLRYTHLDTGSAVKKLAMALGSEWNPPSVNRSLGVMKKRLIYLLTDDEYECPSDPGEAGIACVDAFIAEHSNDDSAHESGVSESKVHVTPESCRQYADQPKQAVDANRESCDSREKLETDVRQYANPEGNTGTLGACWERKMFEFLDRQAAITKRECVRHHESLAQRMIRDGYEQEIWELKKHIDELTEERDEAVEAYDAHMAAHDAWHEAEDIMYTRNRFSVLEQAKNERIEKLTAECDYWKEQTLSCLIAAMKPGGYANGVMMYPLPDGYCEPSVLVADTIDSLRDFYGEARRRNDELTAERDEYREKLSRAIGLAREIGDLGK